MELISSYCRIAGYKVNILIGKSMVFLYTNGEQVQFEIKNKIQFTLAPPKLKILSTNLTKYI